VREGKLKAKGTVTQETRVEEAERTGHQFLCTKEVGTPQGKPELGKKQAEGKLEAS